MRILDISVDVSSDSFNFNLFLYFKSARMI